MDGSINRGVKIIGVSDCGEKLCAAAGRISTQPGDALGIWAKSQDAEKNASLIDKVTRSGHNSTVEHVTFHLAFNDVSVIVEQFLIEFRLASFTVKSRRYVDFSDAGFYVPAFGSDAAHDKYMKVMSGLFGSYSRLIDGGIPKEDARFVLPYCFYSNFFCSLNGREMLHLLHAMLHGRGAALPEIKALGESLLEQVSQLAPGITAGFEERRQTAADGYDLSFVGKSAQSEEKPPVRLMAATRDAAKTVAAAAMAEHGGFSAADVESAVSSEETVARIVAAVVGSNRPRALESVSFTFELSGLTLSTLTHFARHRMHSIQIPDLSTVDRGAFITPETVAANGEMKEVYLEAFAAARSLYDEMKALGESETLPYVMLSGNLISIVSTMNARELLLFFKLRTCNRAQWEIRDYACEMLRQLRAAEPLIFGLYGPSCYVDGRCPEGRLSCGKMTEIKEKFSY